MAVSLSLSVYSYGTTTVSINYSVSGVPSSEYPWDLIVSGSGSFANVPTGQNNGGISGTVDISGLTPGTAYTWTFTVQGAGTGNLTSKNISQSTSSGSAPSWIDNALGAFQVSVAYSDGVSASGSSPITYSVSAGSLPAGISLNSSSGAVTGTPTTAGAYSFTLKATNSLGNVTQPFSGIVAAAPTAGKVKVWTSGGWAYGVVKVWTGSWTPGTAKVWSGSGWTVSK